MASTIEIQGLDERIAQPGKLSTKSPLMQQRIRQVIRQTMAAVRKALQNDARSGLDMKTDLRKAYKAVRLRCVSPHLRRPGKHIAVSACRCHDTRGTEAQGNGTKVATAVLRSMRTNRLE